MQQQGKHVLRYGFSPVAPHVADGDAPLRSSVYVYVVVAGGRHADAAQIGQCRQDGTGDPHFVDQYNICAPRAFDNLGCRTAGIDAQYAQSAQRVPGQIPRVERVAIQNDDDIVFF